MGAMDKLPAVNCAPILAMQEKRAKHSTTGRCAA